MYIISPLRLDTLEIMCISRVQVLYTGRHTPYGEVYNNM